MGMPRVLTVGRISVDLYAEQEVPIPQVRTFRKSIGGTATNVAIAASRLGHSSAVVTRVGDDPFGDYLEAVLTAFGVDTTGVLRHEGLRTPLAFAELDPPEDPRIIFYREPRAPDEFIAPEQLAAELVEGVELMWVPGSRFAFEPSRTTVMEALARRGAQGHTVLDLDYRPQFWSSPEQAGAAIRPALALATVAVGNREECLVTVGTADPEAAAEALIGSGVDLAVVKMGGDGVLAVSASGERCVVPPTPVPVVCGLGAGDAFGGALVHGLLGDWPLEATMRFANAAGALVASRLMCADAMPTIAEIELLINEGELAPEPPPVVPAPDQPG
ncbi:MAG TPA: 5-dehydro-2-deoxygluconokinase [Acidimicrobiales bacterium]|nr:5-dehydro-2-deoxygluconokinase [Acidimicrobiales bacterium]